MGKPLLLDAAKKQGLRVYDRSEVSKVKPSDDGVVVHLGFGARINGQRVVFARGYESQQYLKQTVGLLMSTFTFISEPCDSLEGWPDRSRIWESARPYLYLRTTADNRAIVGGGDVPFAMAHKSDQITARKTRTFQYHFCEMFPEWIWRSHTHGRAHSGKLKTAWPTSAKVLNFHMPIRVRLRRQWHHV